MPSMRTVITTGDSTAGGGRAPIVRTASEKDGAAMETKSSGRKRGGSESSAPSDYYASKRLAYADMTEITLDDSHTLRIKMLKDHDFVYHTPLAGLIEREIKRRAALVAEHRSLEMAVAQRVPMILNSATHLLNEEISPKPSESGGISRPLPTDAPPAPALEPAAAMPSAKHKGKMFRNVDAEKLSAIVERYLYDPSAPEGRTRARFLSSDFPKALADSVALLRAQSAAHYAATTLAPEIAAAASSTSTRQPATAKSPLQRTPSTWFNWISRKTFLEPESSSLPSIDEKEDGAGSESTVALPTSAGVQTQPPLRASISDPGAAREVSNLRARWNSSAALGELRRALDSIDVVVGDTRPIREKASAEALRHLKGVTVKEMEYSDAESSDVDSLDEVAHATAPESEDEDAGPTHVTSVKIGAISVIREILDLLTAYVLDRRRADIEAVQGAIAWQDEGPQRKPSMAVAEAFNSLDTKEVRIAKAVNAAVLALTDAMDVHPTVMRIVSREVEASLFNVISLRHGVASIINYVVDPIYASEIASKMSAVRSCTQSFFGVQIHLQRADNWEKAVLQLRRAESVVNPTDKMFAVQLAAKTIYELYARQQTEGLVLTDPTMWHINPLGADEFFPIFVFVLVQAKLLAPVHLKELLWLLADPAELRGQGGYWLTVYEAALEFVRTVAPPLDARANSSLGTEMS